MAISSILLLAIFASSLLLSATVSDALTDNQAPLSCPDHSSLGCEVEEAKFRIARLESILDERVGEVNAKNQHFRECEKRIEELNSQIGSLKAALSSFEHDCSNANRKLSALEEAVRRLWAESRQNNFEIHSLEYKALDAERRLKEVTSQVGEMSEIVSEQWIQIQQLQLAVHMAEMRTSKIRKELWRRCPFVKFFVTLYEDCVKTLKGIVNPYVPSDMPILRSCKDHFLQAFAASKYYHHMLQGFIRNAMKSNELTAALAHEEVIFLVVSTLVAFPIMAICMLLLSQFS